MKNKNIKLEIACLVIVSLIAVFIGSASVSGALYYLHNTTDPQFTNHMIMNSTPNGTNYVESYGLLLTNLGTYCWGYNWTSPNFTSPAQINGTWNFTLYGWTNAGATKPAYLFVQIFKLNSTGRYFIANTTNSDSISPFAAAPGGKVNITYNLAPNNYTNISVGERISISICMVVGTVANGKFAYFDWEGASPSMIGTIETVAESPSSALTIFDQADAQGGSITFYENRNGRFYANYTNITNSIAIANASCNISFAQSAISGNNGPYVMTYNATSKLYEFNASFETPGTSGWNVTCVQPNFTTQFKNTTVVLSSLATPEFIVKRHIFNITGCTTVACNRTGGNLIGTYLANVNFSLRTDYTYRLIVELEQTADAKSWSIDPSVALGIPTRDQVLPTAAIIGTSNDSIWDDVAAAEGTLTDQNLADGGTFSAGIVTWNPAGSIAITGNDQRQFVNFSYIVNPQDAQGNSTVTFRAELDVAGTDPTIVNTISWLYIDFRNPSIALNNPVDGFNSSSSTINFNWTATDNYDSALVCNLSIDNIVNATNINSANGTAVNYSVTNLAQGIHRWNVTCWDDFNNTNTSLTRTFLVDTVNPTIALNAPINGFNTSSSTINFNWTAADINDTSLICNLSIDNIVNVSNIVSGNNVSTNRSVIGMLDGLHHWNVTCWDDAGNFNTSLTRTFTVDTVKPAVNLNVPIDGFNSSSSTLNFNWTATDNIDTSLFCNLSIDNLVNQSNVVSANNTATNYSITSITNGLHRWNVSCWDDTGNTNTSLTRTFLVDTVQPAINLNAPVNGFNSSSSTINFNWTAIDINDTSLFCNLSIDNIVNISNIASANNVSTNYSVSNIVDGIHRWNVTCFDDSSNSNTSLTRIFTIDTTPPIISSVRNTTVTNMTAAINWTTDEISNSTVKYGTTLSLLNISSDATLATTHGILLTSLSNATLYYYNVTSCDASSNCNTSGPFNVTTLQNYDVSAPVISSVQAVSVTNVSANITWSTDEVSNSTVRYGATLSLSNILSSGALVTAHNLNLSGLQNSTLYYYNVSSCDASGNCNTSGVYNFTTLSNSDIAAPVISNVKNTTVTNTTANVTWTTDESSNSSVSYGTTLSLGSFVSSAALVSSHELGLTGLLNGTLYYYNVSSCDASGNCNTSGIYNVTTLQNYDLTTPVISNVTTSPTLPLISNGSSRNIAVNFSSSEFPINLTFNLYNSSGGIVNTSIVIVVNVSQLPVNYTLPVISVSGNYTLNLTVRDLAGNSNTTSLGVITVDVSAPIISSVQVVSVTNVTANITWTTDEVSNSTVSYGVNLSLSNMLSSGSLATAHNINLSGLVNGTLYYYNVSSCDAVGNCNTSGPYNLTTQQNAVSLAPVWSNNATSPASPATYSSSQLYQFNVTWTDDVAVAVVLFEHNFSGTLQNYSATGNV
ncbi:MAG: fibronectin type III domain-containing protein, partial [Nanoarchaeota archaeon]|nr:fibronectin type III domain-containing protein [Nanoarchaeota archaeon]